MQPLGKRKGCRCAICLAFAKGYGVRGMVASDKIHITTKAEVCENCQRESDWIQIIVPMEVKDFLGFNVICQFCSNSIRTHVNWKCGLCWASSSQDAIYIALLDWLHYQLSREISKHTKYKWRMNRTKLTPVEQIPAPKVTRKIEVILNG